MPSEPAESTSGWSSILLAECGLIDITRDRRIAGANARVLAWADRSLDEVLGEPLDFLLDLRLPTNGSGSAPTDATLRGRSGLSRSVAVGFIDRDRTLVVFDLTAGSSFARSFEVGDQRSDRGQRRLEILLAASTGFADSRNELEAAELLADVAKLSFGAAYVSVHLRQAGHLVQVAGENPLLAHWPADYQPAGARTLSGGEVLVVRSPEDAAAHVPDAPMEQTFRAAGIHGAISSPISYRGTAIGSVICYFDHDREFDDEAVPLAEALASQAAQAIARVRLEDASRRAASLDALTGLPGRRLFEEELEHALSQRDSTLCVMFIDLDRFKAINDELGHAAGDSVLQQVGLRLESIVRAPDAVGRFGGDEFMLAVRVADEDTCSVVAERVRAAIALPYRGLPDRLSVSASIGVVLVHHSAAGEVIADQLIRVADHNMYEAKTSGGDTVVATQIATDG